MNVTVGKPDVSRLTSETAATHEAGHAVIATRLGVEVGKVSITTDGHGMTEIYSDNIPENDRRWAIIGCAGSAAEGVSCINEGDFSSVKSAGFSEQDLPELFAETKTFADLYQQDIKTVTSILLKVRTLSGVQLRKLIKKGKLNMRKIDKKTLLAKQKAKQATRKASSVAVKMNRADKRAVPAQIAKRAEAALKVQPAAKVAAKKIAKETKKTIRTADKLLAYSKLGFVKLTKAEIEQLSESDRKSYFSRNTKENNKNEKKSVAAKARRAPPRKRTLRREMERAIVKAQRIIDKQSK